MKAWLLVGCGSFAGGVLRYGVTRLLQGCEWVAMPVGTLCVNVVGCLLFGLCCGLLERWQVVSGEVRLLFVVGFCGSFTTFSTFIHENIQLVRQADLPALLLYLAVSVVAGTVAMLAGHWLVRGGWGA